MATYDIITLADLRLLVGGCVFATLGVDAREPVAPAATWGGIGAGGGESGGLKDEAGEAASCMNSSWLRLRLVWSTTARSAPFWLVGENNASAVSFRDEGCRIGEGGPSR